MKYHELTSTSKIRSKRVGRGIAAGRGKTAGRGTKGQGARAGYSKKPGFEGGQNPLMQRLPKLRGFRSLRTKHSNVFTDQLGRIKGKVTNKSLAEAGLIATEYTPVKLLFRGDAPKAAVELQGISAKALEALDKAGGSFSHVPRPMRPASDRKQKG